MAFIKGAGNVTVTYNSNALTNYLDSASIQAVVEQLVVTNMGSSGEDKIAGLPNHSVEVGGPWDATLHGYLNPDVVSPPTTLRTLVVVVGGVTHTWTSKAFIGNYQWTAGPNDAVRWTGTLVVSGPPTVS